MMDINEQIKKYPEYFKLFNISEGIAYVCMSFPNGWKIPKSINNDVKVEIKEGKVYFFVDLTNGTDVLFDAVDTVIKKNKEREEKILLFTDKGNELKKLFTEKTIEELRTLKFVFDEQPQINYDDSNDDEWGEDKKVSTSGETCTVSYEPVPASSKIDSNVMDTVKKMVSEG